MVKYTSETREAFKRSARRGNHPMIPNYYKRKYGRSSELKELIKKLNQSTLSVKKMGNKYRVHDVVDYGDPTFMTEKELLRRFG
jgi:hypothetical protein